jgi:hypothetical protein
MKLDEEVNGSMSIKARTIARDQKKKAKKAKRTEIKYVDKVDKSEK